MLTVKVHQFILEDKSQRTEDIFAAYRVNTSYEDNDDSDGNKTQIVHIHTCNDDCYSFPINSHTRIYVENLAKETIQVYKPLSQHGTN